MVEELAVMETDHKKTFATIWTDVKSSERLPFVFDPNNEVGMYLRAMVERKVFDVKTDPCEPLTGCEPPQDILNSAIGLEEDSLVFYLGREEYVPTQSGKDKVRAIIKQEMGYNVLLNNKLRVWEQ